MTKTLSILLIILTGVVFLAFLLVSGEPSDIFQPAQIGSDSTYYVAKDGNNSNPGSEAQPWLTIQQAIDSVQAGDTVYVKAGRYEEGPLTISTSGTASEPIVFSAYQNDIATITYVPEGPEKSYCETCQNKYHYDPLLTLYKVNYVEIHDFYIEGIRDKEDYEDITGYSEVGVFVDGPGGEGVKIIGNHIYNHGHCGMKDEKDADSGYLIEGNWVYNNGMHLNTDHGMYLSANNTIVRGNWTYRNNSWGIHLYEADNRLHPTNILVEGNFSYENGKGGIVIEGQGNIIINNVSYDNDREGVNLWREYCLGNIIKNNIFAFNDSYPVLCDKCDPAGNDTTHNLYYPGTQGAGLSGQSWGTNFVNEDPLFIDSDNYNFQLQPDSPACTAGEGGTYMGAYPCAGDITPPAPPTGVGVE